MSIQIGETGGNANIEQNFEDSELDATATDIKLGKVGKDANIKQFLKGVKSRKAIVWILIALFSLLGTIAGYYFTQSEPEQIQQPVTK